MNQDDVIRMAQEAGLLRVGDGWTEPHRWGATEVERFAALVAAHEREECAKVCESLHETSWPDTIAAAIRARGQA
jgi:hypothetical protein